MKKRIVFLALLMTSAASACAPKADHAAREAVRLTTIRDGNHLVVMVINTSTASIPLNRLFRFVGLDPEIEFSISDTKGNRLKLRNDAYLNQILPTKEEALILLSPGQSMGHAYSIQDIKDSFGATEGNCYEVVATYHDKLYQPESRAISLVSNEIDVCM